MGILFLDSIYVCFEGVPYQHSSNNESSSGATNTKRALVFLPVYGSLLLKAGQTDTE